MNEAQSQASIFTGAWWMTPAALFLACVCLSPRGAGASDLNLHQPGPHIGGISPGPVITSITASTQGVTLTWRGTAGPYQVEQLSRLGDAWEQVGDPTEAKTLTLAPTNTHFLRVQGSLPKYAGAAVCAQCHFDVHDEWTTTAHSTALETLKNIGQGANASCLPCHTVGYGLPTGYTNETTTAFLAGVQCENCHGPADAHARNPSDVSVRPVVEPMATLCGGCHTDVHHPTYENWTQTLHARVNPDVAGNLLSTNSVSNMNRCGPCHSGSVRLALLNAVEENPLQLPSPQEAASVPITCVVCHDPHTKTKNAAQLRSPVYSTKFFSYNTSKDFASQYDPEINACAQCHNARGAAWTDTSRPPHHSPQYSMLVGKGGLEVGSPLQSPHGVVITNQCVGCHMQTVTETQPTPENPNYTGHGYFVKMTACLPCHDTATATDRVEITQADTKRRIATVKGLLDSWATNKASSALAPYGTLAWEYTNPGVLSAQETHPVPGPTGAQQALIPDAIKQARYNLYLVEHDGSFGVHNGRYMRYLLKVATDLVNAELAR